MSLQVARLYGKREGLRRNLVKVAGRGRQSGNERNEKSISLEARGAAAEKEIHAAAHSYTIIEQM